MKYVCGRIQCEFIVFSFDLPIDAYKFANFVLKSIYAVFLFNEFIRFSLKVFDNSANIHALQSIFVCWYSDSIAFIVYADKFIYFNKAIKITIMTEKKKSKIINHLGIFFCCFTILVLKDAHIDRNSFEEIFTITIKCNIFN